MEDCLFCKIVMGEIPAEIVAESEHAIAFRDLHPAAPTHFLVIPRRHIESLEAQQDGDAQAMAGVLALIRDAARATGLVPGGYRAVCNNGPDAGQLVKHVHFHVLGGRELGWPPG